MATLMQQRRGTAAEWDAVNPIMAQGEIGVETDTGVMKVGDGVTRWKSIQAPYLPISGGVLRGLTAAQVALTLQGKADQTADLLRIVDVDGTLLSGVTAKGKWYEAGSQRVTAKGDILVGVRVDEVARLPLGTTGLVLTVDPTTPTGTKWGPISRSADVQVFPSSGTWTKPANAKKVTAILFGGGSSGQALTTHSSNSFIMAVGGAGGGRVTADMLAGALGATETVTVGAGGPGGSSYWSNSSATSTANPVSGGDTVFGPLRAKGGGTVASATGLTTPGGTGAQGTPGPNLPLMPGGGGGVSKGYMGQGAIVEGSSPVGTTRTARRSSGLGGDGGQSAPSNSSIPAGAGQGPGGGGGAAVNSYTTDGDGQLTYAGNAYAGSGAAGEAIIITLF